MTDAATDVPVTEAAVTDAQPVSEATAEVQESPVTTAAEADAAIATEAPDAQAEAAAADAATEPTTGSEES